MGIFPNCYTIWKGKRIKVLDTIPLLLEYIDIIPELDVIYNYCIEAVNECGNSDWQCDTGYTTTLYLGDVNYDGNINILDFSSCCEL